METEEEHKPYELKYKRKYRKKTPAEKEAEAATFAKRFLSDLFRGEKGRIKKALLNVYELDPRAYLKTIIEIAKLTEIKETKQTTINLSADLQELVQMSAQSSRKDENMIQEMEALEIEPSLPLITDAEDIEPIVPDLSEFGESIGAEPQKRSL